MNIFVLSRCPEKAARMQCDKHVVKMILETAQLLCSIFPQGMAPYKRTHYNHPCAIWARKSIHNYIWLLHHGISLCDEYNKRYGKIHKTWEVFVWLEKNRGWVYDEIKRTHPDTLYTLTPFPQAMPEKYRVPRRPVAAYRAYYKGEKARIARWAHSDPPKWWSNET